MKEDSVVLNFAKRHHKEWNELLSASELSTKNKNTIVNKFGTAKIFNSEVDLVVFGSIARNECTISSDVDWTLLVDGQANPNHLSLAHIIEENILSTELTKPGDTGMFGQITFSHDLINYIGGQDDTNHNLTRRILLLLESEKIILGDGNSSAGTAHDRVVHGIIQQYIDNDSGFNASSGKENVPRFLLNDLIRFWRTMCVDFAYKQMEQKGKKWALRNIKLRMSRRLIFVKGLLLCHKFYLTNMSKDDIKSSLHKFAAEKPIEFIVKSFLDNDIPDDYIITILDSYDTYLKMLNDTEIRDHLTSLDMNDVYGDEIFEKARSNSHNFQNALNKIFITEGNKISDFTLKYGVF